MMLMRAKWTRCELDAAWTRDFGSVAFRAGQSFSARANAVTKMLGLVLVLLGCGNATAGCS